MYTCMFIKFSYCQNIIFIDLGMPIYVAFLWFCCNDIYHKNKDNKPMTHNNVVLTESSSRRKLMRSQTHIYTSGTQINTACKHPGDAQASCIQCNGQSVLLTVSYLLTVYIYIDCLWVNIYDKAISQFHFNNFIYHIFSQVQFTQELQLGS